MPWKLSKLSKAYQLATKKFEKSDAAKGIAEIQAYLTNIGLMKYEAQAYDKAPLFRCAHSKP